MKDRSGSSVQGPLSSAAAHSSSERGQPVFMLHSSTRANASAGISGVEEASIAATVAEGTPGVAGVSGSGGGGPVAAVPTAPAATAAAAVPGPPVSVAAQDAAAAAQDGTGPVFVPICLSIRDEESGAMLQDWLPRQQLGAGIGGGEQ